MYPDLHPNNGFLFSKGALKMGLHSPLSAQFANRKYYADRCLYRAWYTRRVRNACCDMRERYVWLQLATTGDVMAPGARLSDLGLSSQCSCYVILVSQATATLYLLTAF